MLSTILALALPDVACQPVLEHVKEELTGALIPLADVLVHRGCLHMSAQVNRLTSINYFTPSLRGRAGVRKVV